jgi:hypothetical protein
MTLLLRREFTVDVPLRTAWHYLARVEQWPSWAKHIRQVQMQPLGELGPQSTGIIYLSNGFKSGWTVTEFALYQSWKWVGRFLWLTVHYDHRFEELTPSQTKLIWIIEGQGFGVSLLGKLFVSVYNKNLEKAIPALIEEMNTSSA